MNSTVTNTSEQINSDWSRFLEWCKPLTRRQNSIINPVADAIIMYTSPLWGLLLLLSLSHTNLWYTIEALNYEHGVLSFTIGVLTTSHLLAVVFRSHLNQKVFRRWPLRFTLVPVLLFVALSSSLWLLIIASILAVLWDVYHAGMQNFGLGRIYDAKLGNDANAGRNLDKLINHVLYAGPLAAGVTLGFHVEGFYSFAEVGAAALTTFPDTVTGNAQIIRLIVIPASVIAVTIYVIGYWRLSQKGYKVSPQKIILMATTAIASIIAWGFNPFATAFAAMNLFHAIQYYGILYSQEGGNITRSFKITKLPKALKPWMIVAIMLVPTAAYGVWEMLATPGWDRVYAAILSVALLHFWYDSFIWSVRAKDV